MHVSIDRERQTAREGALFQTSGLEFTCVDRPRDVTDQTSALSQARRLALVVVADTDQTAQFSRIAALGGERRMVVWREPKGDIPACHAEVITNVAAQVRREQACRVVLLTPACFTAGWRPTWLLAPRGGVQPTLQAVAVQRPHVVSGWDFEHDRPKPTRRLAPAGTVLFLTLAGSADAIEQWVTTIWMQCVSDDAQDRLDGFGLAIIGTWDGTPHPQMMQQKQEQQS
jgi:CRISPR-associated protein Cmr3